MVTFKGRQMSIADNPISKPYLGGLIVAMLAYLEIRISDTLGWSKGICYTNKTLNVDSSIP